MTKKFIFYIMIFIIIIVLLFSKSLFILNIDKPVNYNKPILGSVDYIRNIKHIAKKSGYKSALYTIMKDVNKRNSELDHNSPKNLLRLHILISKLIFKMGYIDERMHYFRNEINRVPKTLNEMIALNKKLKIKKRWKLLSVRRSLYHMQGKDGEYNLKFRSYDGFYEAVYNKYGELLDQNNDPINMGTYNYAAGMHYVGTHKKYDIYPYLRWGNTPNSPQKGITKINKGVRNAVKNYKKHAFEVYMYRQDLFGMQKGRVQ